MDLPQTSLLKNLLLPQNRAPVVVAILLLFIGILFLPTTTQISYEWMGNGPYSHGLLAVPITLYLLWLDRNTLQMTNQFHPLAVIGLLGSMIGWLVGSAANIFIIEVITLFGIFVNSLALVFGVAVWWRSMAAVSSLFLVLPIWNFLQLPLQHASSEATHLALTTVGVPVFRDEFLFSVPGGNFYIEEACSGLGFLLSSCLLSVIYSKVFRLKLHHSVFLMIAAIAISIFSNWLRIVVIMIVGNATQMDHAIVQDHLTFGWILFSVMLLPFFWLANKLVSENRRSNTAQAECEPDTPARYAKRLTSLGVCLALAPMAAAYLDHRAYSANLDLRQLVQEIIVPVNNQHRLNWQPTFVGADSVELYRGRFDRHEYLALLVTYQKQSQGKELIFVENELYAKNFWRLESQYNDETFQYQLLANSSGKRRLIAQSYLINGKLISDRRLAKFEELVGLISGRSDAHMIALATEIKSDADSAHLHNTAIVLANKLLNSTH